MHFAADDWEAVITHRDLSDRPKDADFYLICDELVDTKLPLFFPKSKRIAVLKETPEYYRSFELSKLQNRFRHVITHQDSIDKALSNAQLVEYSSNWIQRDPSWTGDEPKDKLISFIGNIIHHSTPEYNLRHEVAKYCLEEDKIDAFGKGVNPVEFKSAAMASYCFSIALENNISNYYFTEKLIDCLLSATVPIYYGCSEISQYYDERGIITFDSLAALKDLIPTLSYDLYEHMLPYVIENKRRCLDYKHDTFESYWGRVALALGQPQGAFISSTTKPAAGLRLLGENIGVYF